MIPIRSHSYTQEESSLQYSKRICQNLTIPSLSLIAARPKTSGSHAVCSVSLSFSRRSWLGPRKHRVRSLALLLGASIAPRHYA